MMGNIDKNNNDFLPLSIGYDDNDNHIDHLETEMSMEQMNGLLLIQLDQQKAQKRLYRRGLILVIVLALAVGYMVGEKNKNKDCSKIIENTSSMVDNDNDDEALIDNVDDDFTLPYEFYDISDHLIIKDPNLNPDVLFDPSTPEYRAIYWMSYNSIDKDKTILLHQFAILTFYLQDREMNDLDCPVVTPSASVCDWHDDESFGVSCTGGYVTSIALMDCPLSGLPTELGLITTLKNLSSDDEFTGTIPTELGNLTEIERLNFALGRIKGTIPPELSQLTALTELTLTHQNLTGTIPSVLGLLSALTTLNLSNNILTGTVPAEIKNLPKLKKLDLSGNDHLVKP